MIACHEEDQRQWRRIKMARGEGTSTMRYDITFLVGGEQLVERIDAPDAAAAAQAIQEAHGRSAEQFELISVHLIDEIDPTAAVDQLSRDASEVS